MAEAPPPAIRRGRKPRPPGFDALADEYLEKRKVEFLALHVGTSREAALQEYAFEHWLLPGVEGLTNVTAWDMYSINTRLYIYKIAGGLMTENEAKRDVRNRAVATENEINQAIGYKP